MMTSGVFSAICVVIFATHCPVTVVTKTIDVPLLDNMEAQLMAKLDVSRLTNQIRALIQEEVKLAVENSFGIAVKNVTDELKGEYREECKLSIPNVSFHARVQSSIPDIDPWATVMFKLVLTNNGKGYDRNSGIFTAPVNGTYFFTSTILTKTPSVVEMALIVNKDVKMLMYASARNETYNNAANSVLLNLNQHDKVKIVKHGIYGARPFYIHSTWSTFTGILISTN